MGVHLPTKHIAQTLDGAMASARVSSTQNNPHFSHNHKHPKTNTPTTTNLTNKHSTLKQTQPHIKHFHQNTNTRNTPSQTPPHSHPPPINTPKTPITNTLTSTAPKPTQKQTKHHNQLNIHNTPQPENLVQFIMAGKKW